VRARSGYYAPGGRRARRAPEVRQAEGAAAAQPTSAPQPDAALRAVLDSPAQQTAIPIQLSADFVRAEDGVPQVVVSGHIDTKALPIRSQGQQPATVEVGAGVYDENGTLTASLETERKTIGLAPSAAEQAPQEGITYQKGAALDPGRYQVRLAVREPATGTLGSASQWMEIPDLATGRLSLSSLFLMKAEGPPGASAPSPEGVPALRNVQAVRRFRRDESLYLLFYAYNPRRDASGATSLLSQAEVLRGESLLGSASPEEMAQADLRSPLVSHTSRIKLQPLAPGSYTLRVNVTDRNANEKATRSIGFTIE
jgi:hypothetical protein